MWERHVLRFDLFLIHTRSYGLAGSVAGALIVALVALVTIAALARLGSAFGSS